IGLPDLSQFASYLDSPPGASPMIALTLAGFGAAFILAGTEEIAKFIPTYALIRKNISFDEPIDAMIYMITAGLGFALVENVSILITLPSGLIGDALGVITIRFVGATLLHALSSAIVGYYWAHAMANWKQKTMVANPTHDDFIHGRQLVHTWTFFGGLLFASLLHGIFNYLILSYRELLIYPTVFLIIVAFFVFWDFERLKSKQINADSDADQRRSSNPISVNPR
ncbi:PrsW family intramembrane metalloprotease, partial [Candidatus Wolfebacteria bacterium]|nr:PrsW family intramembrane metalloprotease [Candidatus Wolfebacteria bacterium]